VFLRLLDTKFNGDFKNVLKTETFYSKWILQVILSLTVLSNCVSVSLNFDTAFLSDCIMLGNVFKVIG